MEKIIYSSILALSLSIINVHSQIRKGDKLPESSTLQADYYVRESIPFPKGEVMEIGSIALMPDRKVAVATRRGEIWICTGAYEKDLSKVVWKKVYHAAHEPLGMYYKDGWLYFTDRGAVGRISDKDANGIYESYELINNDWGLTGDYHEYAFGSTPDKEGNIYTVHCLTGSFHAKAQWRGWCLKITPDGKAIPFSSGIRSPGGIGYNAAGDVFYTDNQGAWNGTSCIKPLKQGAFTGNPTGNVFYKDAPNMGKRPLDPINKSRIVTQAERIPEYMPPAIQIPHGIVGQSPTALITDTTKGKFGPFGSQMLVGEQTHSQVQRVYMEKVNDVYQGAVWKMLDGFRCGIVPMRLSDDGTLFVGGTNRGWASIGGKAFSFERVRWTGKVPFEMLEMKALPKGFEITFTEPIDEKLALDAANYDCKAWTYVYRAEYGSPEVDKLTPKVTRVEISSDRKSVKLTLDKMTKGHIHHINCDKLKSLSGASLWHSDVYYTLNEIPKE